MRVEIEITDIGFGGSGVGRVEGMVVMVPFVALGERVEVEIVRKRKGYALGRLVRVIESSPLRVEAPCPYFQKCGGCSYQHLPYPEQLRVKRAQIVQALGRIGGYRDVAIREVFPSPKEFGFRKRITVHSAEGRIGFHAAERPGEIVDIAKCMLADEGTNERLSSLRRQRPREGSYTLRADDAVRHFVQTNEEVAAAMLSDIRVEIGGARTSTHLVDAYCGAGFFMKGLADLFGKSTGIEADFRAVSEARSTALDTERYVAGDVGMELPAVLISARPAPLVVLLDPPRTGLAEEVIAVLLEEPVAELIYISCDPATQARDLKRLAPRYRLRSIFPYDMFPQTSEVESIAWLDRILS